jgi:hypothetical protein
MAFADAATASPSFEVSCPSLLVAEDLAGQG